MASAKKMVTWPLSLRDHDLARPVVRVRSIFVIPFRQPPTDQPRRRGSVTPKKSRRLRKRQPRLP